MKLTEILRRYLLSKADLVDEQTDGSVALSIDVVRLHVVIPFAGKIDVFSLPGAHRLQFRDYPGGCNIPSNFEIYPRLQS